MQILITEVLVCFCYVWSSNIHLKTRHTCPGVSNHGAMLCRKILDVWEVWLKMNVKGWWEVGCSSTYVWWWRIVRFSLNCKGDGQAHIGLPSLEHQYREEQPLQNLAVKISWDSNHLCETHDCWKHRHSLKGSKHRLNCLLALTLSGGTAV